MLKTTHGQLLTDFCHPATNKYIHLLWKRISKIIISLRYDHFKYVHRHTEGDDLTRFFVLCIVLRARLFIINFVRDDSTVSVRLVIFTPIIPQYRLLYSFTSNILTIYFLTPDLWTILRQNYPTREMTSTRFCNIFCSISAIFQLSREEI